MRLGPPAAFARTSGPRWAIATCQPSPVWPTISSRAAQDRRSSPPRFVSGEQVRRRPPAGFIFEIQAPFALSRRKHGFESPRERH